MPLLESAESALSVSAESSRLTSPTAEIRLSNHVVVSGQIEYVAPVADAAARTIELTVIIENTDNSIRAANCELVLP